jgi:hypothetical protein
MTKQPFPVLNERALNPVGRRLLRSPRRDLTELPNVQPGTMLVFDVNGQYETTDRRHLSGAEQYLLDAIAVSLVDMRPRVLPVDVLVPSASPADDFLIRTHFHCVVAKADVVAKVGLTDAGEPLKTYLKQDRTLLALGANFGVDQLSILRDEATSRIAAYCEVRPPRVPGMDVMLATVEVFTPNDLRAQEKRMRDELWDQRYNTLKFSGERESVDQMSEMLANPEEAQALAVARGDISAGDAAVRAFAERDHKRESLQTFVDTLKQTGHLDRIPIDAKPLVDSLTESITGQPGPGTPIPLGPPAARRAINGHTPAEEDEGPRYVVDKDDLED